MIRVLVVTADDIKVKKYLVLTYTFDLICEVTIPFSFSFFHYFVSLFLKYHFETSKKYYTAQKNEFLFKDFFIKCDQIRRILQIWSHLLNTFSMENLIFCAMPETIHHKLILRFYEKIALLHDGSFQH